jgi:hypothetical protein
MTSEQRAHEIVSAVLDMCGVQLVERRHQLDAFVAGHLDDVGRRAAEKAVTVYRQKTAEASQEILTETALRSGVE